MKYDNKSFLIEDNWNQSNYESIKKDEDIIIYGEKDNGDSEVIKKNDNKYLKFIILFSLAYCALVWFVIWIIKKLKKKYKKKW